LQIWHAWKIWHNCWERWNSFGGKKEGLGIKVYVLNSEVCIHSCCHCCWWDFGGISFDHEQKKTTVKVLLMAIVVTPCKQWDKELQLC
jgi:hypothetical protein